MSYRLLPQRGQIFVAAIAIAGTVVIAHSISDVWRESLGPRWLILAVLTLLSGSATVKLPSVPATISISETFVFTSVLLYGPSAGTTIVALDGLIISSWFARRRKEFYRIAFNMAAPALSIWIAAQVYFIFPEVKPLISSRIGINQIVLPLLAFTFLHFVINSLLIAVAVSFETGRNVWDIWRKDFLWLSLNYFGGASVSALLVVYTRDIDPAYLSVIVPLLLILYFTFKIPMARVEDTNRHLTKVNSLYLSTIETLALAIDAKDQVTHGHIRRVQTFAVELAKSIGISGHEQLKAIEASALLHDMGKLAVPEHILNKPGKLTEAEFEKMKLHASIGADILSSIEFPYPVVPIVRHHHENWDGTGYPTGISGIDIPIGARILSVVDCFDALTSDRPYRPRLDSAAATRILLERRSTMYDPMVVDAFIKLQPLLAAHTELGSVEALPLAADSGATDLRRASSGDHRTDEISLFRVYQILADSTDRPWQDTADLVLHRLSFVIPFDSAVLMVYDPIADELICETVHGEALAIVRGKRLKIGQGLSGWVAAHKRTVLNSPGALDSNDEDAKLFRCFLSSMSTPILNGDALIGVITLYSLQNEAFSRQHAEIIEGVASHLSPLLRRRRAIGHSGRSLLAGYLGAAQLDQYLRQFMETRPAVPLCLLVLRVDRHAVAASWQLSRVVGDIYSNLRGGDLVFVCDDNTLVCFISDGDETSASAAGDRIVRTASERTGPHLRAIVVRLPESGATLAALLDSADLAFGRTTTETSVS
jgi:putative nucleotidyltransferase with HDIG domain